MLPKYDLTGRRFGKWKAIRFLGGTLALWECICDCGTIRKVTGQGLRQRTSTQCKSCALTSRFARQNSVYIGTRFGKWTVLSIHGNKSECRCDCGIVKTVKSCSLRSGTSTKCVRCGLAPRLLGEEGSFRQVINGYKVTAIGKGLVWELDRDYARILMKKPCFYCGKLPNEEPITAKTVRYGHGICFTYNGIDRQDNNQGYTSWNCVTCCVICNFAKRNMKLADFMAWIERLKTYQVPQSQIPEPIPERIN